MISVFDMFSVGIGPSSSHTVGPMRAACAFASELESAGLLDSVHTVEVELHGSLAATGHGHGTPAAVILGLEGNTPELIDPLAGAKRVQQVAATETLNLAGRRALPWSQDSITFSPVDRPAQHPNAMTFTATTTDEEVSARWYSIGGGFILRHGDDEVATEDNLDKEPYPFASGAELLSHCDRTELTIAQIVLCNEESRRSSDDIDAGIQTIWDTMNASITHGLRTRGELPGGLGVRRRAASLSSRLAATENSLGPDTRSDRLGIYAMAVNEENASGGRVVTAPTNGAAGVIPAVLRVALEDHKCDHMPVVKTFLLTAAAIGSIIKHRASISGAEVGCQGEVGSACAMAAAGMAAVHGGSPRQVENAAEIGMEHHLGMTCDPIGGLVQIPCIERNSMAAVKAVHAARTAILGDGTHRVSLDQAIETMRQTGADMSPRYKETSTGGLAINVVEC